MALEKVDYNLTELDNNEIVYKVRNLPPFNMLKEKVDTIIENSTWYERHGVDWIVITVGMVMMFFGIAMTASNLTIQALVGWIIYGLGHTICSSKAGHIASHGSLTDSSSFTPLLTWFFVEFCGGFSWVAAYEIHIKSHHPHTNIIGLGDSSIWKVPQLPKLMYMFFAPILLPIVTPLMAIVNIWGRPLVIAKFLFWAGLGYLCVLIPVTFFGYSWPKAILFMMLSRAVLAVSYVHVNIFQHIGMSMYSAKDRPSRLFQMVTGVLNLYRNPVLDWAFGHSLISCHVEHHLFPRLSDNMCLKIQPTVQNFLRESGLPYNQDSYISRLKLFLRNYEKLMVDAPPITHFAGLQ